jgi:hypothetical protein
MDLPALLRSFFLSEKRPLSNSGLESAGRKPALGVQVP